MSTFVYNCQYNNLEKVLYSQVAAKTVANIATETSLTNNSGALGSLEIPANFLKVGTLLHYNCRGKLKTTSTPTALMKFKFNSTDLISSTITLPTVTDVYVEADVFILCKTIGATGTCLLYGKTLIVGGPGPSSVTARTLQGADVTINTTIAQTLDHTYQWGTASVNNTVTIYQIALKSLMAV